jgi:hypothetical protein
MGLMGLSEIMDKSIEILRKYIKTILLFTLGYGVICGIAAVILIIIVAIFGAVTYKILSGSVVLPSIIFGLLGSFLFAFFLTYNTGLIKIASQDFLDEKIYADDAIGISFKSILKVFGIVLIAIILFIPIICIFAAVTYLLFKILKYPISYVSIAYGISGIKNVTAIIIVIGMILAAIITVLSYLTFLSFSLNAAVIEKKHVFSALKRSYELVKNDFRKIFGSIILFSVTILAVKISLNSFIGMILSIVYLIIKFLNMQVGYTDFMTIGYTYVQWPLNLLLWLVISPISTIMMCNMYFNQRYKKEGYDIVLNLKKIQRNDEREQ